MYKISIVGNFGGNNNILNGQTVKTKTIAKHLVEEYGLIKIKTINTSCAVRRIGRLIIALKECIEDSENVIILPAENGLRLIAPLLYFYNKKKHRKLIYIVIGGWLSEFISNRGLLKKILQQFDYILVETEGMRRSLIEQGFCNASVFPNFKDVKIRNKESISDELSQPIRLATFSRVMKEKGIEQAVNCIRKYNDLQGRIVFSLDIYGSIQFGQEDWFNQLKSTFPQYIKYCGKVNYNQTSNVLSEYEGLLFLTYYSGEGFAGTIIDAMSAGLPVIATDWKYNSEVVSDYKNGILLKNNTDDEVMKKLSWIEKNPMKWHEMKLNAIDTAHEYEPEKIMKTLYKIIV